MVLGKAVLFDLTVIYWSILGSVSEFSSQIQKQDICCKNSAVKALHKLITGNLHS